MKLPKELEQRFKCDTSVLGVTISKIRDEIVEAIVRDCAEIAFFNEDGSCTPESKAASVRILTRYDLEPEGKK